MSGTRNTRLASFVVVALGAATLPAAAVELGLGIRAGTYGIGADLGVEVTDRFGVRVAGSALDVSTDYDETGVDYDADVGLGGLGAFADWYPSRTGGFRVSAGVLANRNEVDLTAVASEPVTIGDDVYPPEALGSVFGTVDFDDTAPYFGIGWGRFTGEKRLGFLFDLGVVRQGAGDVTLTSSTGIVAPEDLEAEAARIEEDIEEYELWPVVSFGLAIRF